MRKKAGITALGCAAAILALLLSACGARTERAPDYAKPESWAYYAIGPEKDADLFLVCPTVDMGRDGNLNMSMSDEDTKANFEGALNMERGIYEDSLTLYAPYYRQAAFPVYSLTQEEAEPQFSLAYSDVKSAFEYYIEHSPADRPFVLAGFSQGSDMVLRLLKDCFDKPEYRSRLIAAYCIGWRITEQDVSDCPWLKPAKGAEDTGVIISFNSEAEGVEDSLVVPEGVKTLGINPLNWKTDDTPAAAEENHGACFTDYDGKIVREEAALTGAYLDASRGTLKLPDIVPEDYSNSLFPDGVYHLYDYQFFYRNLQENVALRTAAYLAAQGLERAA